MPTTSQFADSIGVATHLAYGDGPYGDFDVVEEALLDLGVRHIRDGWPAGNRALAAKARRLAEQGVSLTFVHDPREGGTPEDQHASVVQNLLPAVVAAESLNEWDVRGEAWADVAVDWTKGLSRSYSGDPRTSSIPILAPSISQVNDAGAHRALAGVRGHVDYGNVHDYPGKDLTMNDTIMNTVFRNQALMIGDAPVMATETGYSDGDIDAPYETMSREVIGELLPRLFFEHFRRGIVRTFAYELMDEGTSGEFEDSFGLVDAQGDPKPSYVALRNLLGLVSDIDGVCGQAPLEMELVGGGSDLRSVLLRGGDDQYFLATWRQVPLWVDGAAVDDRPVRIALNLENELSGARLITLRSGATPQDLPIVEGRVEVPVSGSVSIVELAGVRSADPG